MKRMISLLLLLCLCAGLVGPATAADTENVTVPTIFREGLDSKLLFHWFDHGKRKYKLRPDRRSAALFWNS